MREPGPAAKLEGLDAPRDPRLDRDVPAFGEMATVEQLDEVTTRVLAPNPSPMTLDGTNTYVVGVAGSGEAIVIDPGPNDPDHLGRVQAELQRRGASCRTVVVTHHHIDHAEAAPAWADALSARLLATTPEVAGARGEIVREGGEIGPVGLQVTAVATPGHCADHLAYRLGTGAMLAGDHVLGRGTSVVAHPDGDLVAYLDSVRRVLDLGPHALYPGHGPALTEDPSAVLRFYLDHRRFRERQILTVLASGPRTPRELVERIYTDVDERLWPAAEASTRAALDKLMAAGQVGHEGERFRLA